MKKDQTQKKKRLVLLDSHAIIHRAYHALPDFSNSKGEPTGAIYGLSTMLFKIITELSPDYIVACYDLPKKTFRHEAYEAYKAGRSKADESLVAQLIKSRDFFESMSIPFYQSEGFEADDLLGTICHLMENKKDQIEIIIASGDMDTLQLIKKDFVSVYTLKKGINDTVLYDKEKVVERFGFEPESLPDYKGLRGDPSDNIIGIKGIGEKTASVLIGYFKNIESLYQAIKSDSFDFKKLGITDRVLNLLKEGEEESMFSKTLATIRTDAPIDFKLPLKEWRSAVDKEKVFDFLNEMEFRSLQSRFLHVLRGEEQTEEEPPLQDVSGIDKDQVEKAKICYWLLNSERTNPDFEEVSKYKNSKNFNEAFSKLEDDVKKEELDYVYKEIEMPIVPIIKKMEKNGIMVDRDYLKSLSKEYSKELSLIEKNIFEMAGENFNINSPKQISEILFNKMNISKKGIKKSAGGSISTRESELEKLAESNPIAREILKYREIQKLLSTYIEPIPDLVSEDGRLRANFIQTGTTTGRFSSNNPNLQNIPTRTERGKNIRNAFIAKEGSLLVSFDYSQIELRVAALMSKDPYFIKTFKEGRDIHKSVAMKVFGVDENGVTPEMRRRAKIINFGILYGMGVNALRQNLITTDKENEKIDVSRAEAQEFYDNYFSQFPTIASYLDSIKDFAKKYGYTKTLFGRKRYFNGLKSPIPYIRAMAERMAVNAPIQGTATADIIKIGMKKADEEIEKSGLSKKVNLVLQVHDELIYEVEEGEVASVVDKLSNVFKNVLPKDIVDKNDIVPLEVSVAFGKRWGDLK